MKLIAIAIWTVLAGAAVLAMFRISFEVEKLEARLQDLNSQIAREQEAIHVLQAEWSYLNRPQRIEDLAQELLPALKPVSPDQYVTFARLPRRIEVEQGTGTLSQGALPHGPVTRLAVEDNMR